MTKQLVETRRAPVDTREELDSGAGAKESSLVELALRQGVGVDVLERIVALQERVTAGNARSAFLAALEAFQSECPPLKRSAKVDYVTKTGVQVRYNFAPLDEIASAIRPILSKHRLSYSWDSTIENGQVAVTCTLHHVEGHSRTATFRCPPDSAGSPTMNGAQKAGSALSYGQRYSLVQVLGLTSASDDVDGQTEGDHSEPVTPEQEATLNALIREVGANEVKFLEYMEVERVADLPASRYAEAVKLLEQKRRA